MGINTHQVINITDFPPPKGRACSWRAVSNAPILKIYQLSNSVG
jgi:hypothetical protein